MSEAKDLEGGNRIIFIGGQDKAFLVVNVVKELAHKLRPIDANCECPTSTSLSGRVYHSQIGQINKPHSDYNFSPLSSPEGPRRLQRHRRHHNEQPMD